MRDDHHILLAAINNKRLTLEQAKQIYTKPLFVIPSVELNVDNDGQIVGHNKDNPWSIWAAENAANYTEDMLMEAPLSEYSVLTGDVVGETVRWYYFTYQLVDGETTCTFASLTNKNGVIMSNYKEDLESFESAKHVSHFTLLMWLDYAAAHKLTPVLKETKETPVAKKAKPNLALKSAASSRILFLDKLPSVQDTPEDVLNMTTKTELAKGHERIAHRRTLTNPRYKNHPKYLVKNGIRVSKAWVGPKIASDSVGNTYTVMQLP